MGVWLPPWPPAPGRGGGSQTPQISNFTELEKHWRLKVAVSMLAIYEKSNELQSPSWTFSKIFKTSLRNLVSGLFLVQAEDCNCGNSVNQFVLYATYFYPLKTWVRWYIEKGCIGHNWVEMKFIYISRITFLNIPLHVTKVLSSFGECRDPVTLQKRSPGTFYKKAALKKLAIIRKKPPVLGSLFNNFAALKAYKFIK